jgi:hypothetical protein
MIELKNLIGKSCRIRELTARERKQLLTERKKTVNIGGETYEFAIATDDDLFLVNAFLVKRKLASPGRPKPGSAG